MEDADWNSYRQKLCCLMHRTDICGRTQLNKANAFRADGALTPQPMT